MKRVAGALVLASVACGGSPAKPSTAPQLGRATETSAFVFRCVDGDQVEAGCQEAYREWPAVALQVNVARRIVLGLGTRRGWS